MKQKLFIKVMLTLVITFAAQTVMAEDGSRLWLRHEDGNTVTDVVVETGLKNTPALKIAVEELQGSGIGRQIRLANEKDMTAEAYNIKVADDAVTIKASTDNGLLYGVYALIRQNVTGQLHDELSAPAFKLRMLNHWDNPDLSVERGYAGKSIFKWEEIDKRGKMSDSMMKSIIK